MSCLVSQSFRLPLCLACLVLAVVLPLPQAVAAPWLPFGPYGGDARSLVADPHNPKHLYAGTAEGWIYDSHDGGDTWQHLFRIGKRDDLVLDHILIDRSDTQHLLIGAWGLGHPDGGVFSSRDGGHSWTSSPDLQGQSVLALAAAPSNPKIYVAGTLKGVYRSEDSGAHWTLISPAGSMEIHEVESIAIDPVEPEVIYAGTWHLPWKTTDGGKTWSNIKDGIIDDSDVFSIIVDPKTPSVVYASACSGIYKSENAGAKFAKVQGIPSTARRTRVLKQDVQDLSLVFAGTTEGLFRTSDAGKTWIRTTDPSLIVNDIYLDPTDAKHLVLATDRAGILSSHDGGTSFVSANRGFSARQVTSLVRDPQHPATLFAGVINDKQWGGVFQSEDGGLSWVQRSAGLAGRDVFALKDSPDGTLVAGTSHGIFRLEGDSWKPTSFSEPVEAPEAESRRESHRRSRAAARPKLVPKAPAKSGHSNPAQFTDGVFDLAGDGDVIFAATNSGVLASHDSGRTWTPVSGLPHQSWRRIAASGGVLAVADLRSLQVSSDGGTTWRDTALPQPLTQIEALAVSDGGEVWVAGREGLFSQGKGQTDWTPFSKFFLRGVRDVHYDSANQRLLVSPIQPEHLVVSIHLPDHAVRYWNTGWTIRAARPVGDHLVGVTAYDGVVVQPRMVDSPLAHPAAGGEE